MDLDLSPAWYVGAFVLIFNGLAVGVSHILQIVRHFRGENDPPADPDPATTARLHQRIDRVHAELRTSFVHSVERLEAAADRIQETVNSSARQLGEMAGRLSETAHLCHATSHKLDRHIENHPPASNPRAA